MMLKRFIYLLPFLALCTVHAGLEFKYALPEDALGLTVRVTGKTAKDLEWEALPVTMEDVPYMKDLFANPKVMSGFAAGAPRDPHATAERVVKSWMPRFLNGQPHGGLTLWDVNSHKRIGHAVAGGGEGAGVSEIAISLMEENWNGEGTPSVWQQRLLESVGQVFFEEWVPVVAAWGRGDGAPNELVVERFKCFGGEPLSRVDMTCSPSNLATFGFAKKNFEAAKFKLEGEAPIANFSEHPEMPSLLLEAELSKLFSDEAESAPFTKGTRYRVIGPDGKPLTISHHERFNVIKTHWERAV